MKKTAKHPSGLTIFFDEEKHTYTIHETGQVLESVTTFIGRYFPKFDVDEVAPKCVGKPKYKGMTEAQIREAWEKEAERGRTEGTNVHYFAECLGEGLIDKLPEPQSDREMKLFNQVGPALLDLEERFIYLGSEIIVFSPRLGLAGTIDLLMFNPKTYNFIFGDWKQNKKIETNNPWEKAFHPISHLDSTDFNKYTLQLSTYEMIVREENYLSNWNRKGYGRLLIHLHEDYYKFIKMPDMRIEVFEMLQVYEDIPF